MSFERSKPRGATGALVLVAALVASSAAHAASAEDRAAARQHSNQAEALKKQGQLAQACQHWAEVERLDPKLPTLMDLAECTEELGNLVDAQAQWALARDRAKHDEKPQSRARAEARLAAVQKRIAHLTLQLPANAPAGAQVFRDDVSIDPATLGGALPMNPGAHVFVVKLAGHADAKFPITLAEGDNQTLSLGVGPAATTESAPAPPAPVPPAVSLPVAVSTAPAPPKVDSPPPTTSWWSGQHKAGVIFGAAGLVGLGVGSALCLSGGNDQRLVAGGISLSTGGVLFVSGAVLLASGSSEDASQQHAALSIAPAVLVAKTATVLGATGEF